MDNVCEKCERCGFFAYYVRDKRCCACGFERGVRR